MKSIKSQNYYEILGVTRSASPEEIRNAYEVSKHTFQDNSLATYSLFTDEENQEILALISRAYETLFNPELRREYDAFLDGLERESDAGRDVRANVQPRPHTLRQPAGAPRARPAGSNGPVRTMAAAAPGHEAAHELRETIRDTAPAEDDPMDAPPVQANGEDEAADKYIRSVSCFNGPVLKKIRQMRGLSREQIAERTKIRKTYIEYLEEENFTFLPAPVYIKGFVTMIAGMLDLPAQRVAEDYMSYYRGNDQL